MKIEYKLITSEEIIKNKYNNPRLEFWEARENLSYEDEARCHLYRFEDGVAIYIASDGGEPEDQSFYRDLSWIIEELRAAYELGLKHGKA